MKIAASLIALAVLVAIVIRIDLNMDADNVGVGGAFWNIYRFFTIWTNTLVGVVCAWIALGGRPPQWMTACLALAIAIVGGVYHAVLAQLVDYSGIAWVVDHLVHTVVPIAFVVLWAVQLPKGQLTWKHMLFWLGYPLIYCVYAIGRGAGDGIYPYPFLNVANLGAGAVAVNVAGLVVVFALGGLLMLGVGRMARGR